MEIKECWNTEDIQLNSLQKNLLSWKLPFFLSLENFQTKNKSKHSQKSNHYSFLFIFRVMSNSTYHDGLDKFIKAFRHDSHPMGMMSTLMAALSTFYPEANPAYVGANVYKDKKERNKHIYRILGCAPAIAAACCRHRMGLPIN